jgi:hypothetical protein
MHNLQMLLWALGLQPFFSVLNNLDEIRTFQNRISRIRQTLVDVPWQKLGIISHVKRTVSETSHKSHNHIPLS